MKADVGEGTEGAVVFVGVVVVDRIGGTSVDQVLAASLLGGGIILGIIKRVAAKAAETIDAPAAGAKLGRSGSTKTSQTPRQGGTTSCS